MIARSMSQRPSRALPTVLLAACLTVPAPVAVSQTPEVRMAPRTGDAACDAAVDALMPNSTRAQQVSAFLIPVPADPTTGSLPPEARRAMFQVASSAEIVHVRRACAGRQPATLYAPSASAEQIRAAIRRAPAMCVALANAIASKRDVEQAVLAAGERRRERLEIIRGSTANLAALGREVAAVCPSNPNLTATVAALDELSSLAGGIAAGQPAAGSSSAGLTNTGPTVILAGQSVVGTLVPGDQTLQNGAFLDVYRIEGRSGQRLVATVTSDAMDVVVGISGNGLNLQNDNAPGIGTNARLEATLPADGVYVIGVTSYGVAKGPYRLSVQ
jgi:hypothetical protein